jgi:hypothetical protein
MGYASKYKGIDSRKIKCCCLNGNCIEAGISIEEDKLFFHYLDWEDFGNGVELTQKSKMMVLNKKSAKKLIKMLKEIEFKE